MEQTLTVDSAEARTEQSLTVDSTDARNGADADG